LLCRYAQENIMIYQTKRSTARELKEKFYFTGKPCIRGHLSKRRTNDAICEECKKILRKENYDRYKNDDVFKEKIRNRTIANREEKIKYDKKYAKKNRSTKIKRAVEWQKNNKERRRDIVFNYDSKRRAFKSCGASLSEVRKWRNVQIKECYWCGVSCQENYHVDHYVPLSKGGKHEIKNLVISCPSCNLRKNAKMPDEWIDEIEGFDDRKD